MVMKEEKMEQINKAFKEKLHLEKTDIAVTTGCGVGIKKGIMVFCNLEELSDVIRHLTILRDTIVEETGIRF